METLCTNWFIFIIFALIIIWITRVIKFPANERCYFCNVKCQQDHTLHQEVSNDNNMLVYTDAIICSHCGRWSEWRITKNKTTREETNTLIRDKKSDPTRDKFDNERTDK